MQLNLCPVAFLLTFLGKSAVNPPLPLRSIHSTPSPIPSLSVQQSTDPAWPPLDVSQKCENKMALDLLTHRAECDCRRRGVGGGGLGVGEGVQLRPLSFIPPTLLCPPLWPGAWQEDVEEVCRQLELSESKVGRQFDWPVRGMLTLEISPVCRKPRVS